MMKPKKRLSAGMGFSADGIDPQFEFDVPRLFVDLTLPPKYVKAPFPTDGDASPHALLAHDPWFDLVHEHHSRPTEEFLDEQEDQHSYSHTASASGSGSGSAHRQLHNHQSAADGEKENAGGGVGARLKRRNVAYSVKSEDEKTKAALRTASAVAGGGVTASGAVKKKLPFGNSTKTAAATTSARKRPVNEKTAAAVGSGGARSSSSLSSTSTAAADKKDLHDLQALLAKHNKKFKSNHTYEPRQHSVRDVRQWERQTHKSYYKLSSDDRIKANAEIALLVQARDL